MKKLKLFALSWVVLIVIFYLCFAFVEWQFNPNIWQENVRLIFILFGVPISSRIAFGIAMELGSE